MINVIHNMINVIHDMSIYKSNDQMLCMTFIILCMTFIMLCMTFIMLCMTFIMFIGVYSRIPYKNLKLRTEKWKTAVYGILYGPRTLPGPSNNTASCIIYNHKYVYAYKRMHSTYSTTVMLPSSYTA